MTGRHAYGWGMFRWTRSSALAVRAAAMQSELVCEAMATAHELHDGEFRDSEEEIPFVDHPMEVADLLGLQGLRDEAMAVGLLHDALEYTDFELQQVRERCGEEVAAVVAALSEDFEIEDEEERRADLRRRVAAAGEEALHVFAADKLHNATTVRESYEYWGEELEESLEPGLDEILAVWDADVAMLSACEHEIPLAERLSTELQRLRELRGEGPDPGDPD